MKSEFRSWSDVRVFLAVFRSGSTLAASRSIGMAQPTVARRIEALEAEIGLTLFERDTRGFKPTENARKLLDKAKALENAANEFSKKSDELGATRPIRITAYSANFSRRMTDIINDYTSANPEIEFEFLPSVRSLDLKAGEADIALRVSRTVPDPDLICRKISDAKWTLFAGKPYVEKYGIPKSVNDFKGHKFVSFQRGDIPNDFHAWLLRHVEPDQIVMKFTELDLMHAALRSGHGLGISNIKLMENDDEVVSCFDEIEHFTVPHNMLISPEAYRRPEVRKFTKYFAPRYAAIFRS